MTEEEQSAILTLSLMAAFADGAKDERERAQLKSIVESISAGSSVNLAALYQDVLLKRRSLAEAAQALQSPVTKQLAYEMAVCVCDADGAANDQEQKFLEELRDALGLEAGPARAYAGAAAAIASAPLDEADASGSGTAARLDSSGTAPAFDTPRGPSASTGAVVAAQPANAAELDRTILNYSILNGALELLPQSLATMAIIPLQMKMVYRIGKAHGYELDRGHIKDLLATLGVGLTSQYVEEIGRKLIGGLLRKVGGSLAGALGRQATGSAMAFATTYALGRVARQYYGGGRTLDMDKLRAAFQSLLGEAQALRGRYIPQIEQKARTLDVNQLLTLIRQQ